MNTPTKRPAGGRTILVTGGTGSFGQAFVRHLLAETDWRIRILSRDEHKQQAMMRPGVPGGGLQAGPRLTYILGDVRDIEKTMLAADGCTDIVHAAALKTVPGGEWHADEFIRTNIIGSLNIIQAAIRGRVPRSLLISTDKSCLPINTYGHTKAAAERAWVQANARGVGRGARFSAVRGGNVWRSNGSVALVWEAQKRNGEPLTVNGPDTTRFHMEMGWWCNFVRHQLEAMRGGEIFVPRVPAWRLGDLAEAFENPAGVSAEPARMGDKAHELMVSADESPRTLAHPTKYIIQPSPELRSVWSYQPPESAATHAVPEGFVFTSETAERLTVDELRELVKETCHA